MPGFRKWLSELKAQRDEARAVLARAGDVAPNHVHAHEHFDGVVHAHVHGHADHDHRHDHAAGRSDSEP